MLWGCEDKACARIDAGYETGSAYVEHKGCVVSDTLPSEEGGADVQWFRRCGGSMNEAREVGQR